MAAWGGYTGYTGKKLNEFIEQTVVWHYREAREIRDIEVVESKQQREIAQLNKEIMYNRYE